MKKIEVELRSFLSDEEYKHLLSFFTKNAKHEKGDFQETYYFDCDEDVRIQKNRFGSKIWMKSGKIHDEAREETEVEIKKNDFEGMLSIIKMMGIGVKIGWFRKRDVFLWDGVKVCIDDTEGYGKIIEMEKKTDIKNKDKALKEIRDKFEELGIKITSRDEFEKKYNYYSKNWTKLVSKKRLSNF